MSEFVQSFALKGGKDSDGEIMNTVLHGIWRSWLLAGPESTAPMLGPGEVHVFSPHTRPHLLHLPHYLSMSLTPQHYL